MEFLKKPVCFHIVTENTCYKAGKASFFSRVSLGAGFACAAIFACAVTAYSYNDGFLQAGKKEGRYCTVYYSSKVDIDALGGQLNVGAADILMTGPAPGSQDFRQADIAAMLDTLFERVSDILDMHVYTMKFNVRVCSDDTQLTQIYKNIFQSDAGELKSFYNYELNTIYISAPSFTRGVIGHEIAHAVISHYFVVPPPIKAAEVLAGYVEYQLRKSIKR